MSMPRLDLLRIHARLALAHASAGAALAWALCMAAAVGWAWTVPHLRLQQTLRLQALKHAQAIAAASTAPAPAPPPLAAQGLAQFYETLGDQRYVEQQVKTLFAIARQANLTLQQADYTWASDKNGRYHTYQISLPMKGSYSAIRRFFEDALLAIPFMSLDEIDFARDVIANQTLEVKVRFTVFLADAAPTPQAVVAGAAGANR